MAAPRPDQVASRVFNEAVEGLSDVADYLRHDPVPPIWRELKKYSLKKLKRDAIAGATVAIITIPQAIGFALIVGIPVQAVLVTAIIGGVICALFSSSHHLIFGPTNTISIILAGALVTNRFLLIGAWSVAVFLLGLSDPIARAWYVSAAGATVWVPEVGRPMTVGIIAFTSVVGVPAGATLFLAFFPTRRFQRSIVARAKGGSAID